MSNSIELDFMNKLESLIHISIHTSMTSMHLYAKQNGLSISQMVTLMRMRKYKFIQVKDVAKRCEISRPAASQLMDKLVQKGLVLRLDDSDDRRVKNHKLSEQGETLIDDFFKDEKEARMGIIDFFTINELETMVPFLDKLAKVLKEYR